MSGIALSLTAPGLDDAIRRLARLQGFEMAQLADDAGALLESSARDRFETKEAPDGTPWAEWSEAYDETRNHDKHSLLVGENNLLESVQSYTEGSDVTVGSNLIYAAHHQLGGEEIGSGVPERPFLGMSSDDVEDLRDLVTAHMDGSLQ